MKQFWLHKILVLLVLGLFISNTSAQNLTSDKLLLIVNRNEPAGVELATYYARQRNVPADQILQLDLPQGDDISRDQYDRLVATPVRNYINDKKKGNIRCLVTFYGMPLRVGAAQATHEEAEEVKMLKGLLFDLEHQAGPVVEHCELIARNLPLGLPRIGKIEGISAASARVQAIQAELVKLSQSDPKPETLKAIQDVFVEIEREFTKSALHYLSIDTTKSMASTNHSTSQPAMELQVPQLGPEQLITLAQQPRDAKARDILRRFSAGKQGIFALAFLIDSQLQWMVDTESDAAVDSELAGVMWLDYPKYRWQGNPLFHANTATGFIVSGSMVKQPLMVSRIDAPTPEIARRIIDDSIKVEKTGLTGQVVFDGRGIAMRKPDGQMDEYGIYDQLIRNATKIFNTKSTLKVLADDRPAIILPNTASETALYCGWYSVRQYIPSCKFVRGAVAFHVASYELINLHDPNEKGWCANQLRDGAVATLGAVSEPYLSAFPHVDEFFPLLATGKMTLAEAYWATMPQISWKICLVGDPLYNPFANKPSMKPEDLPASIKSVIMGQSSIEASPGNGR